MVDCDEIMAGRGSTRNPSSAGGGRKPGGGGGGGGGGGSRPSSGEASYSTAFSHIILAGTGTYCFQHLTSICSCAFAYHISRCSFIIVIVNSVIGVWRFGNPLYGASIDPLYGFTTAVQDLFVLPLVAATLLEKYGYPRDYIYATLSVPVIPLLSYLIGYETVKTESEKLIAVLGCAGIAWLSFINDNYYGMATCASYIMISFFVKESGDNSLKIPTQDLCNYAMCFFSYFALRAILD